MQVHEATEVRRPHQGADLIERQVRPIAVVLVARLRAVRVEEEVREVGQRGVRRQRVQSDLVAAVSIEPPEVVDPQHPQVRQVRQGEERSGLVVLTQQVKLLDPRHRRDDVFNPLCRDVTICPTVFGRLLVSDLEHPQVVETGGPDQFQVVVVVADPGWEGNARLRVARLAVVLDPIHPKLSQEPGGWGCRDRLCVCRGQILDGYRREEPPPPTVF